MPVQHRRLTASPRGARTMTRILGSTVCATLLLASALPARTATASNTFQVTATVISACTISGATLNFGSSIDPLATATPLDASSTLSVVCTNTTPYTVALDAGQNAGGATNFGARSMKSGSYTLGYQLYLDAGRSSVWGNGTGSSVHSGTGTGSTQNLTIYGRLPSLANVVPGAYTDTVTVTISY